MHTVPVVFRILPGRAPSPELSAASPHVRFRLGRLSRRLESRSVALSGLPAAEVVRRWSDLRSRVLGAERLCSEDLVEALALASSLSPHVTGLSPYPVQRLGALVLASGMVAQMRTGEGKTLSTGIAALALASLGRGVHVVTANEYLASRDRAFLEPFASALNLSVGLSRQGAGVEERRAAYLCDVTYGTASSFGFDYLYDNLAMFAGDVACREPFAALVDEADSVLLDEATTPLLVSVTGGPLRLNFARMDALVAGFVEGVDVHVDRSAGFVSLLDPGIDRLESGLVDRLQGRTLFEQHRIVQQACTALEARLLLREGHDYLVVPGVDAQEVVLVDANTGRRRTASRLRAGLHEALEAKEGLPIRPGGTTRALISLQKFFVRYPVLGGLTGTAVSAAAEFAEFYGLPVVAVPTHRRVLRRDLPDRVFASSAVRDDALCDEVAGLVASGRPVLVACESVNECVRVGGVLASLPGSPTVRVLSARDPGVEVDVVSRAGEPATVTVATAMAGRGVDIVLGGVPGSPGFEERRAAVLAAGGLAVVSTCRYPSARVDEQLRGRAGRQGEPGSSLFLLSFDDELPRRYAPGMLRGLLGSAGELPARSAVRVFERAQRAVEGEHQASRREVAAADLPLEADREAFYAFRRRLLGLGPWERTVATVSSAFGHRLDLGDAPVSASLFEGLWPSRLVFPDLSRVPRERVAASLAEVFVADLAARLSPLEPVPSPAREELLGRLVGALVLDSLDLAWAGHLEAAAGLHADTRLVVRTGQDPDRVYRALLRRSFDALFERFFRVALTNLAGLEVTGVGAAPVDGLLPAP
jgi:preprotein translocase subunit SecA